MSPIPEKENTHRGAPSRNYILLYRESIKNKKTVTKKKKKKKKLKKNVKKKGKDQRLTEQGVRVWYA